MPYAYSEDSLIEQTAIARDKEKAELKDIAHQLLERLKNKEFKIKGGVGGVRQPLP